MRAACGNRGHFWNRRSECLGTHDVHYAMTHQSSVATVSGMHYRFNYQGEISEKLGGVKMC
jgi:hypothetical protein